MYKMTTKVKFSGWRMLGVLAAIVIVCILAGMMSSCSQDDTNMALEPDKASESSSLTDQQYIDYLSQVMGFNEDQILITDSVVLVEGDISFSKENLRNDICTQKSSQDIILKASYRSPYSVTATTGIPVNINGIQVNGTAVSNWRSAVTSAIADWNALSGNISFYIVDVPMSPANSINIFIGTVSTNSNDAEATFPTSGGNPGANLVINQNTYNSSKWTTATRRILMTHEIGHCIGLAHSDPTTPENGMIYIPTSCGTNVDNYSIMHHNLSSSNYITSCDEEAFYYLY
jgi:hypothetical protein